MFLAIFRFPDTHNHSLCATLQDQIWLVFLLLDLLLKSPPPSMNITLSIRNHMNVNCMYLFFPFSIYYFRVLICMRFNWTNKQFSFWNKKSSLFPILLRFLNAFTSTVTDCFPFFGTLIILYYTHWRLHTFTFDTVLPFANILYIQYKFCLHWNWRCT